MTEIAYEIVKKVYEGKLERNEERDEIAHLSGMAPASASAYISDFICMMNGEKYARTLNEHATRYFLLHIRTDYGEAQFKKALDACKKHAEYYKSLGHGKIMYIDRIIEEFSL